ncbi:MAG: putative toxin-antitoxin system toxin component, PIN family [Acidimicrobiales bacterium]
MAAADQTPPIVLDTNVLVAGACRHETSHAYQVLMGVLHGQIPLMLSQAIALEYQDVLQRSRIRHLTGLNHQQSEELISALIALSQKVQIYFSWRPNLTDESDNKFVELAMHTGAAIITYNHRDYQFGEIRQHGWYVMSPREFVVRHL